MGKATLKLRIGQGVMRRTKADLKRHFNCFSFNYFPWQVCRLAYEIMNNKHTDASQYFHSLDDIYYFGGQQEHKMRAIWPHEATGRSEINLEVGDIVGIAGKHFYLLSF